VDVSSYVVRAHIFVCHSFEVGCKERATNVCFRSRSAMSNPNGLLSQQLCYYLNQRRTLNDILMRAAQYKAYFDHSKPNLA